MKPRAHRVDGGRATARVPQVEEGTYPELVRTVRNENAYWNVLAFAKEQPDPADFARDILSALGLDGKTDAQPASAPLVWSGDMKAPGPRAKTATQFPTPTDVEQPPQVAHIDGADYRRGCRCIDCRTTYNTGRRRYTQRRREAGLS